MHKQYFSSKKHADKTLIRIFIGIIILLVVVYIVYHFVFSSTTLISKEKITEKLLPSSSPETKENSLEQFQKMLDAAQFDELRSKLKDYVGKETQVENLAKAYLLWIDLESKVEKPNDALSVAEEAKNKCSSSIQYPYLQYRYAQIAETLGKKDVARSNYQEIIDRSSKGNRAYGYLGLARLELQDNNKIKARDLAQRAVMDAEWDSEIWNEALDMLGKLNVELIFSNLPTPESKVYTVQAGDTLTSIGSRLNTPIGMLCRANQISEDTKLRLNQTLKYTPKDFRLFVERSKCRAFLVDEQGIFKRYKVGLGKPGQNTTLGTYKIGNKQKNPTWFKPGEGPIPPGDPRNELGTRWMPLVPSEPGLPTDLGLHGTIAPETIGSYSSNGCVRFYPEDIEEIYDLIVRSTPVIIKEEIKFEDIFPLEQIGEGPSNTTTTNPPTENKTSN
ncbi:MAG TPA: L,D-transpeptidase family protein [Candidatus Hydrogenedens sp.]|nr:L,D-transpeptidase family protein [Candidatus Hydrogenedens sp.]